MEAEHGDRPTYVLRALDLFAEYGDREAIVGVGWDCHLTYAQVRAMVLRMAARMRDAGFRPGRTVAVMVTHPPEALPLQFALHLLGCRTVWVAPAGVPRREIDEYLARTQPELFIYDTRAQAELGEDLARSLRVPVLCLGPDGLGPDLLAPDEGIEGIVGIEPFDLDSATGRVETVFQTSGTTGMPKPILHGAGLYEQMCSLGEEWAADGKPLLRFLSLTPMWHAAGQAVGLLNMMSGGVLFILYRFRSGEFLAAIEEHRATAVYMSPLMFYKLLDDPALATTDCSSLQLFNLGGAAVNPARLREGIRHFGPIMRITYGLSELPFIAEFTGIDDDPEHPDRIRSCGRPYGDVRVEVRDEHGDALPTGATGELWVRSRLSFVGYPGLPELTEEALVDGWVRTRDVAQLDEDGYLYLVGRTQDMIVTGLGQYHIFPRPIEDALVTHPAVRAAAVIGVPHETLGEAAHAYVVTAGEATVTEDELTEHVSARLKALWAPRSYEFVDDLPQTASGKADTKALKARWAAAHRAETAMIGAAG